MKGYRPSSIPEDFSDGEAFVRRPLPPSNQRCPVCRAERPEWDRSDHFSVAKAKRENVGIEPAMCPRCVRLALCWCTVKRHGWAYPNERQPDSNGRILAHQAILAPTTNFTNARCNDTLACPKCGSECKRLYATRGGQAWVCLQCGERIKVQPDGSIVKRQARGGQRARVLVLV